MRTLLKILMGVSVGVSCNQIEKLNENPITINAYFMQYACGDWNDDMKIQNVTDSAFKFIVGKDIDPAFLNGESEISGWLFDNKTQEFGMSYQLKGYISKCAEFGCNNETPKFWITEISKLNGQKFDTSGDN